MFPYTEGRNCILLPFEKEIVNLGFAASVGNVFSQGNNLIYHPLNYRLFI